jgi:hypothetical protein
MTSHPAPRPALQKAADGSVHPASPRLSSLAVVLAPPGGDAAPRPSGDASAKGKAAKKGKKRAPEVADELTEVVVTLPKSARKQLRKRAAEYGWTAEEAAAHVLRVWAEH